MGASASTSYSLEDVKVKYEQLESTLGPVELPAPFAAAPDAIPLVKACEAVGIRVVPNSTAVVRHGELWQKDSTQVPAWGPVLKRWHGCATHMLPLHRASSV